MNRLTNKYCNNYDDFVFSFRNSLITCSELKNGIYKKLKQLEDIEEELGTDLITLFKALKDGFYFKYKDKILSSNEYSVQTRTNIRGNWVFVFDSNNLTLLTIKIKDYGNTWWLSEPKED